MEANRILFSCTRYLVLIAIPIILGFASTAWSSNGAKNGGPFQALQDQIDELRIQIESLELGNVVPIELEVDCKYGDTVNGALASVSSTSAPVTVTISGICDESVGITRDDVTLRGITPSDGIQGEFAVYVIADASRVTIDSMTLVGSFAAFTCSEGASAVGSNLTINDSAIGVLSFHGGNCQIVDSVISNGGTGLLSGANSYLWSKGSTIQGMVWAANVVSGGGLYLEGTPTNPATIVRDNVRGINTYLGGATTLNKAIIETNIEFGLQAHSTSAISFSSGAVVQVQNNLGNGIVVQNSSSMSFLREGVSITGNGEWGIFCNGATNIFEFGAGTTSTMTGNVAGNVSPECNIVQVTN